MEGCLPLRVQRNRDDTSEGGCFHRGLSVSNASLKGLVSPEQEDDIVIEILTPRLSKNGNVSDPLVVSLSFTLLSLFSSRLLKQTEENQISQPKDLLTPLKIANPGSASLNFFFRQKSPFFFFRSHRTNQEF